MGYTDFNHTKPTKIFDHQIDWCKFLQKHNKADLVSNYLLQKFTEKGDTFEMCPVKKGFYHTKVNDTFNVNDFPMAEHIIGNNENLRRIFKLNLMYSTKENQKFVLVYNATFIVEIRKFK